MLMGIMTSEQAVLDLLLEIPPRNAKVRTKIKELDLATDSITKVGIRDNERVLHIFDRKTFWKVAQW